MNLKDHIGFHGSAGDLAALAIFCGKDVGLPVDPDKTNERLVRYYVSEGVLDRPDRVGRDADYGFRHLLQLLTARRLVQAGMSLSVIAAHNGAATTRALEEGLGKPLPTAAELLVISFQQGKRERGSSAPVPPASLSAAPPASRPAKPAPPSFSLVDVLDEFRQFRQAWMGEMAKLHATRQEFVQLRTEVRAGLQEAHALSSRVLDEAMHKVDHVSRMAHLSSAAESRPHPSIEHALAQVQARQEEIFSMLQTLLERLPEPPAEPPPEP